MERLAQLRSVEWRLVVCLLPLLLAGCASLFGGSTKAVAYVAPTSESHVKGTVLFEQRGAKVMVIANIKGLPPDSEHGFHIHEKGDCSNDAMNAGAHFNPENRPHGVYNMPDRHAGDLPNLRADSRGVAQVSFEVDTMTVMTGPYSIVGRSLIITTEPDDYRSQPDGQSGARIACGVIGMQ